MIAMSMSSAAQWPDVWMEICGTLESNGYPRDSFFRTINQVKHGAVTPLL